MNSPTNILNDYLQSKQKTASLHWQDEQSGPNHAVVWTSTCKLDGVAMGTGSGPSKRLARAAAARITLAALGVPTE